MIPGRISYKLAAIAFGLALSVVGIEAAVRIVHPRPPLLYTPDPMFGWVHKKIAVKYPGANGVVNVQFNSKGLRDTEHPYKKPLGTRRILILGDSYSEAVDVELEQTFGKQLESMLNATGRPTTEVINTGVGGYGTDQEYLYLNNDGWKYEPDVVLLMFTVANDVHDNVMKQYCHIGPAGLHCMAPSESRTRQVITAIKALLQEHLQSYFEIRDLSEHVYPARLLLAKLGLSEFKDAYDVHRQLPNELQLLMRQSTSDLDEGWKLTLRILDRIAEQSRSHNARFAILTIPGNTQINSGPFRAQWRAYGVPDDAVDTERPNRILREFAEARGIQLLDTLPDFRTAVESGRRVINGHWTAEGHTLVARKAAESLHF